MVVTVPVTSGSAAMLYLKLSLSSRTPRTVSMIGGRQGGAGGGDGGTGTLQAAQEPVINDSLATALHASVRSCPRLSTLYVMRAPHV